jgi:hypothetical protein
MLCLLMVSLEKEKSGKEILLTSTGKKRLAA